MRESNRSIHLKHHTRTCTNGELTPEKGFPYYISSCLCCLSLSHTLIRACSGERKLRDRNEKLASSRHFRRNTVATLFELDQVYKIRFFLGFQENQFWRNVTEINAKVLSVLLSFFQRDGEFCTCYCFRGDFSRSDSILISASNDDFLKS